MQEGTTGEPVAQVIGTTPRAHAKAAPPESAVVVSGIVIIGVPPSGLVGLLV
jgi:hypothetical protein